MRLFWIAMAVLGAGLILLIANHGSGQVFGIENNDFARILYLGVLGAVLAAGVLAWRADAGYVARSLAIWTLIVLVLVGGYQYRYELQDIASRMTAGLVPGSPVSMTGVDGDNLVMVDKAANGHFQVRATIDGETVSMLVDTGATSTVLSAEDAARIGFDIDALSFDTPVMTANGTARAARVVTEEIAVGSIERQRLAVFVAEPERLAQSLLGMNFIDSLSGFEVRGDRLVLHD